jgi:hypothetical protein
MALVVTYNKTAEQCGGSQRTTANLTDPFVGQLQTCGPMRETMAVRPLLVGEEGTSSPVERRWRCPVSSTADRGLVAARCVIFSATD